MSKSWNRPHTWLVLIVGGIGTLVAFIVGLHVFMTATATPLHPDPQRVPTVTQLAPSPAWAESIDRGRQVVRTALADQNLPGLSVAVGIGGDVVWAEGFGWADLDERVQVAPDMRFRIGTASTALTSAAVGLLLEQGTLTLDAEMQTYVPELPKKQWPVTLGQVMSHQAGIPSDSGDEGALFATHCERPVEALHEFADDDLRFEPGTRYHFSNYGYILVSAAIETAAREPFLTFMRGKVFEPLGMQNTKADPSPEQVPNQVTPYFPRYAADPKYGLHTMRNIDYSCYAGASVFVSTPSDLVRFGLAINGGKLLQPDTVQRLQAPQRLRSGEETGYGLGWDVETVSLGGAQVRAVGHDGDLLGGQAVSLLTIPERGIVVAVTANISYADTFAVASKLAEAFAAQAQARAKASPRP
jgi:serine beta-lactamase-like protein LACTB, mitochondrial